METIDKKFIVENIRYDCDNKFSNIYNNFPKLKNELLKIANKLVFSIYVINSDELTEYELKILKDNDYIR